MLYIDRIRQFRQNNNITQKQVADLLDHAPDIISRIKSAIGDFGASAPAAEDEAAQIEEEYDALLKEDLSAEEGLSPKELKKRRKLEAKTAKKAAKAAE